MQKTNRLIAGTLLVVVAVKWCFADQASEKKPAPSEKVIAASNTASSNEPAKNVPAASSSKPDASAPALAPGHSLHGEAFDEGPRQKAYLMKGMPKVDFAVSTKSTEAQAFFNQGVGQLHGFWYFEAERSFRQVAALDPECAMAYWGMAMANVNNEKRAKEFIAKARAKKASATPRERAGSRRSPPTTRRPTTPIAASSTSAISKRSFTTTRGHRGQGLPRPANLDERRLDDREIQAGADLQLQGSRCPTRSGLGRRADAPRPSLPHPPVGQRKAGAGAQVGRLCGQSSPGIAHMWHMPGHIYSDLHRYADAAWQQEASARVDHAYMIRDGVLPDQILNYAHNNEWLIRDLAAVGRVNDAIDLAKNMLDLPRHPKYNSLEKKEGSAHYGRERLVSTLVQYERWADLIALATGPYLPPFDTPEDKVERARLLGRAQAELGNLSEARGQLAALNTMLADERTARYKSADEAESKARATRRAKTRSLARWPMR